MWREVKEGRGVEGSVLGEEAMDGRGEEGEKGRVIIIVIII